MPITSLFRFILIAGLIFAVLSIIAGFSLGGTLPPILQEYIAQVENAEVSVGKAIFVLLGALSALILLPITTIGLWMFKSWARTLYVIMTVISIPLSLVMGAVVMNSWEAMFFDISLVLEGGLLAMMFTGAISQKFKPSEDVIES